MSQRQAPVGMACWADLWTSDVDGARRFYAAVLGWSSTEPDPRFGGYVNFTLSGTWVAGCMGDMGEMRATDTWKVYLASDDIGQTFADATDAGATVLSPVHPVADLGFQFVFSDPTGADLGAWEAGSFPGFTLHTCDHARAVAFYRSVFGWQVQPMADTDAFRYSTVTDPRTGQPALGIFDARATLADGSASHWLIYFQVDDVDVSSAQVPSLGGTVVDEPKDTPYGRMATVADPCGATFRILTPPS
jgi:predicted enzyme related to lactoylglutathione lyase